MELKYLDIYSLIDLYPLEKPVALNHPFLHEHIHFVALDHHPSGSTQDKSSGRKIPVEFRVASSVHSQIPFQNYFVSTDLFSHR